MSMTVPRRVSVPQQADGGVGLTIDLDAPAPAVAAAPERTRTDGARDAIHVGACALAGVLITIGFWLDPARNIDDSAELVAAVAEAPNRFYAANLIAALGLVLVATVGLAVLRLVRGQGRGRVLASVGGILLMIGGTAAATGVFMYGSVMSTLSTTQDAATAAAADEALSNSARTGLTFMVGFPGMMLGLLLCAAALFVSRATPRWVPAALVLAVVGILALGSTDLAPVANLAMTAGLVGIGLSLWKATHPAD